MDFRLFIIIIIKFKFIPRSFYKNIQLRLILLFSEFPAGVFIHLMLYGSANAVIRYKNKTTLFAPTVTEIDMVDSRSIHVIHRFVLFICKHHVRNVSIT